MLELASSDEGKKIVSFIKNPKKNKLIVNGSNGSLVFQKAKTVYIEITIGQDFGIIDIVGSALKSNIPLDSWITHKDIL